MFYVITHTVDCMLSNPTVVFQITCSPSVPLLIETYWCDYLCFWLTATWFTRIIFIYNYDSARLIIAQAFYGLAADRQEYCFTKDYYYFYFFSSFFEVFF